MVLQQPQVVQGAGKEKEVKFSEEVLDEYKRAKQLQEKDGGTTVSWKPIVEGLGLPAEEAEAIAAKTDGNGLLDVPETLTTLAGKIAQDDSAKEALAAFAFLGNKNTGTIEVEQLRHILSAPGQKLSDADLDAIIKSLSKDGQVNYRDLIAAMISSP
eukprot:comp21856_c6_seq1/m.31237 comp21856_c6_seq1/g.31237  ORF comp21856_c6_seq1/g.31237 comp21856_c6_seq1/m.31237 type:complete len:157 (-) comp21856_c6_seq1:48-518(-)